MRAIGWAVLFTCLACAGARAESDDAVAAFYRGKTITIIVSTSPGGLYDGSARLLANISARISLAIRA